jgi:hypothetical protein
VCLLSLIASGPVIAEQISPCEAFGAARAVFIGRAEAPVTRSVIYEDGLRTTLKLSPVVVERAFRGAAAEVMYITPAGIETYLTAGEQYLVYGHDYGFPNIVMSAPDYGTKPLRDATRDLEFLDAVAVNARGASVNGMLEVDESDSAHIGSDVRPLPNVAVRLSSPTFTATALTAADGQFALNGVPPGRYTARPQLPDDLALSDTPAPLVSITSTGGCASMPLRAVPNGRIYGVLRNVDGTAAVGATIALMPAELGPDDPDRYFQSVGVNGNGRFEFARVQPGRYILGRLAFNLNGQHRAAVYYPGLAARSGASLLTVGRGETVDVGEFLVLPQDRH